MVQVRSEWHSMPDPAKAQVYEGIWGLVRTVGEGGTDGTALLSLGNKRLCLALAAAAARAKGAAENSVQQAIKEL